MSNTPKFRTQEEYHQWLDQLWRARLGLPDDLYDYLSEVETARTDKKDDNALRVFMAILDDSYEDDLDGDEDVDIQEDSDIDPFQKANTIRDILSGYNEAVKESNRVRNIPYGQAAVASSILNSKNTLDSICFQGIQSTIVTNDGYINAIFNRVANPNGNLSEEPIGKIYYSALFAIQFISQKLPHLLWQDTQDTQDLREWVDRDVVKLAYGEYYEENSQYGNIWRLQQIVRGFPVVAKNLRAEGQSHMADFLDIYAQKTGIRLAVEIDLVRQAQQKIQQAIPSIWKPKTPEA